MIKIIDVIDIIIDFLISDDVNAGFNDVKTVNSINDVNIITNANNNYFYWVNHIKYVMNVKDIIDVIDIIIDFLISDDVYAGFNDVKNVISINDENIVTNANNNYLFCINDVKFVKNIKDINDILDPCASDEVKNINDFDHKCQTRQLTKLNNGSYYRGRLQEQYLFWLLVTKMASGNLKTIFVHESSICATIATPGDKIKQLRKMVNGPGCRY